MTLAFLYSSWFKNVALCCLAMLLSAALTPLFALAAQKLGIVAVPVGGRHIHTKPTPLAGAAVFAACHAAMGVAMLAGLVPAGDRIIASYPGFLLASSILLVVGLVDDARNIKPLVKLAGQIAAALCVFFVCGVRMSNLTSALQFPPAIDCAVTVFWIVLVINAFNLIDGMDGVAAGLAAIIAGGTAAMQFFLHNAADAVPYMVLAGACVGFLRHNFNPASVFLGDAGSMFIGLTLATLPLVTGTHKEFLPAVTIPLLMMGIPFFDTVVAIWRRAARSMLAQAGVGMMVGDKDHVHHRVLGYFASQRKAAFFLYGVNALLVLAAFSILGLKSRGIGLFLVVFMAITALIVRHLSAVELWDTGRLLLMRRESPRWQRMRVIIYFFMDLLAIIASWFVTRAALSQPVTGGAFRTSFLLLFAPLLTMLLLFRVYNRIWTRARPHEFAAIPCAVATAGVITLAVFHFMDMLCGSDCFREIFIFCVVVCWPLLGTRMFSAFLRDFVGLLTDRRAKTEGVGTRTVVFGCGGRFGLFLYEHNRYPEKRRRRIVGLLDDDILLKNRLIAGFKVFGPLEALPLLVGKTGANELLVTPRLTPERRADILRVAKQANCRVTFFEVSEVGAG